MSQANKARHTVSITPERSIESLIEELEQLQIQQAVVIDAILDRAGGADQRATPSVTDTTLAFQATQSAATDRRDNTDRPPNTYRIQDNVRITNSVRVNGRVSNSSDDYTGVVEKVTKSYIHVRTKSNRLIRRAPTNLSHSQ